MRSTYTPRHVIGALVLAAFVVALALPAVAAAQSQSQPSLAELARQEADRRKAVKDTKKVITAKDLPESARRTETPAPAHAEAAPASTSAQAGSEQKPAAAQAGGDAAGSDNRGEAFWQKRMGEAREGLRRNQMFLDALQARVNGLTMDYDRHDSFERATIGETRKKALEEIEKVKADVEQSKKQIADIEEEARKAGVPPGWLR